MNREKIVEYLYRQIPKHIVFDSVPEHEGGWHEVKRENIYKIVDGLIPMIKSKPSELEYSAAEKTKLTRDYLLDIGFKEIPHFTIMNSVVFDLGRNRFLSAGSVGTPNEMLYISEVDENDPTRITDLICLHNYDYDGYITLEKISTLIYQITSKTPKKVTN